MAEFRGTVQGGRGEAARLGHSTTGLSTTCRGWNVGVDCHASGGGGENVIGVYMNEGNGYNAGRTLVLGHAMNTSDGPVFIPSQALVDQILRSHGVEGMGPIDIRVAA